MRISIALILVLAVHVAGLSGQTCRVCQRAASTGGGHHITEPGEPTPGGRPGHPHCCWTWDDTILPPPISPSAQSTGRVGMTPYAQAVANVAGAVMSASIDASTFNTRVVACDVDAGVLHFCIEDTTMGCTCHTIPAILCTASFDASTSLRLHRQASPSSYVSLRADQSWVSTSGASMGLHLSIHQTPILTQTGNVSGGIQVGNLGGASLGGGGFPYVLNPPPVTLVAMDNDAKSAPGAGRDDGLAFGSVVAQTSVSFTGPPAGNRNSVVEGALENYLATWTYLYSCPVCGTSGSTQFNWTE